ncbi:response regulator [Geminicoccaceae bacterium 1502E]|nr:response regulator [Geminicoccaceae bacterium 1502E]
MSRTGTGKSIEPTRACRVLLVEDESLVAMLVEDMLHELGCEVVLAMRFDEAMRLAQESSIQMAVLDVNLGSELSYPVADVLRQRGIPFLFATGYGTRGLESSYRAVPTLQKPFAIDELARLMARARR